MTTESHTKVSASHLKRNAYLYVRQSTVRQVFENTESTKRQYALRQRAIALGWSAEQIIVIDSDLGQSGASAADRAGFQRLVAEVGVGRAGIVLGLEVSRLARNSSDWHRLLEICALADTLILDEDGVYDPTHFNDRLLLGLKGTMSEAELHVLGARLRGGLLNKARRGELAIRLPVGLVYDASGRVVLDPDQQVQQSVHLLFETFARTGAAVATVKHFRQQQLLFPKRLAAGPCKGEVVWEPLGLWRALSILHNPRYAGAYVFGRGRWRARPHGGPKREAVAREHWLVLLRDAHAGYISWEHYEQIQTRIAESARAYGSDRRHGPPREGPALLQGRVLCGVCGDRMSVRYHRRGASLLPDYICQLAGMKFAARRCQSIPGGDIDAAVGKLLVEAMTPLALEVSLAVQDEMRARVDEADRLRLQHVERAQYEVEVARRRYMLVDPANRLVADSLEADWNHKLRALTEAREHYERQRETDRMLLDEAKRTRLLSLARDFPAIWNDGRTPDRERKRMVGLLIEDVTLTKGTQVTVQVRFRGGATTMLTLPLPLNAWQKRETPGDVVAQIDTLLDQHTEAEVAATLNAQGLRTGAGAPFSSTSVQWVRKAAGLQSFKQRLHASGMVSIHELARALGVSTTTVKDWRRRGLLQGRICSAQGEWLYHRPNDELLAERTCRTHSGLRRTTGASARPRA